MGAREMTQLVEGLATKHGDLGLDPQCPGQAEHGGMHRGDVWNLRNKACQSRGQSQPQS